LHALCELLVAGIIRGGIYALMAVGLSLAFGVMNVPQFAHGEFYMLGAYVAYFAFKLLEWNPLLAITFAGLAGFAMGALTEKTIFGPLHRRTGENWVLNSFLVTVGLSFVMQNTAQAIWGGNYFGVPYYWKTPPRLAETMGLSLDRAMNLVITLVSIVALLIFLRWTSAGRAIRAVSQDEKGAMLVGIDLDQIRTLTFALSGMLAALAGGSLLSMVPAHPTMGLEPLYKSWYVVILGGLGSVGAAIPAGLIVGTIETLSYYFFGAAWQDLISLSLIILILLFKPNGIFGSEVKGIWER